MKFYYPSPFLREMSDIDILIHGDFMEQAAVELEAMGVCPATEDQAS